MVTTVSYITGQTYVASDCRKLGSVSLGHTGKFSVLKETCTSLLHGYNTEHSWRGKWVIPFTLPTEFIVLGKRVVLFSLATELTVLLKGVVPVTLAAELAVLGKGVVPVTHATEFNLIGK